MRARLLALGLGTLVMSLPAANAMAHDGWWRNERPEYRYDGRGDYDRRDYDRWDDDRDGYYGRYDRDERYERYRALQARYQANLARYYHELREGDWREAQELREQLRCDEEALYRARW